MTGQKCQQQDVQAGVPWQLWGPWLVGTALPFLVQGCLLRHQLTGWKGDRHRAPFLNRARERTGGCLRALPAVTGGARRDLESAARATLPTPQATLLPPGPRVEAIRPKI